jgi:ParB-like chromosome segregation protein Spo0J
VVDEDLVIIKGHGRYLAAKELGLKTVPVVIADYLTPAQVRAARIADNKLAESEWFPELLALELKALQEMEFDLSLTGFGEEELAKHLTSCEPLGEMPALPSGDKSPFQEMVFTVLDEQAEQVKKALSLAKKQGPFVSDNLNNNGNALTRICETYSRQYEK